MMRCKTHLTRLSPRYGVIDMKRPLEKLKNIAEELNVPYAPYEYIGEADEYAVYAVTGIGGDNYANNRAQAHIAQVELDYIQPIQKSYQAIVFRIIDLMIAAGFTEPTVVIVNDSNIRTILRFTAEFKI